MNHLEALQQLSLDRGRRLRHEADVERLALQARGQRLQRRRRLALDVAFERLLRGRHGAGIQAPAWRDTDANAAGRVDGTRRTQGCATPASIDSSSVVRAG